METGSGLVKGIGPILAKKLVGRFGAGSWEPVDWSPDGQKVLVLNGVSAEESYLWLMDANSGEKTLLTAKGVYL